VFGRQFKWRRWTYLKSSREYSLLTSTCLQISLLIEYSAASRPASNAAANSPSSTSNEGPQSHGKVRKKLPGAEANTKLKKKRVLPKDASKSSTISNSKNPEAAQKAPNGIKQEQGVFSTTKVKTEPKLETPVKQEVKKERVVYDLPGQTKPTPLEVSFDIWRFLFDPNFGV